VCSKRFSLAKLCMSGPNCRLHPTAAMSLFRWTSGGTFGDRQVGASRLTIPRTRPHPQEQRPPCGLGSAVPDHQPMLNRGGKEGRSPVDSAWTRIEPKGSYTEQCKTAAEQASCPSAMKDHELQRLSAGSSRHLMLPQCGAKGLIQNKMINS